jgi:hypothetical protein
VAYTARRGFTVAEVEQAIRDSAWTPAELNRPQCRTNFPFNREWNGTHYATKQVRPVFVEHADEIVVILSIRITF